MSLETQFINPNPPSNPTIPEGTTFLPIHPISLWPVGSIPSIHVFPGVLDLDRLMEAIRQTSGLWPNICGRFIKRATDGQYGIEMTASPVPFSTQTLTIPCEKIPSFTPFPTENVIQPSLDPYLPSLGENYFFPNSDAHLVSFRFTTLLPSKMSVLGVMFSHILGDASAFNALIETLSHFYVKQGKKSNFVPTFFPHIALPKYPPTQEVMDEYRISQLEPTKLDDMGKGYIDAAKDTEMITLTLSRGDIRALRESCDFDIDEKVSDQDVLSGWWATVMRRSGHPLNRIVYPINYRNLHPDHPGFPSNLPTLSANVAQMRLISFANVEPSRVETEGDIAGQVKALARCIRAELKRLRDDPEMTLEWLSNAAFMLETAAEKGYGQVMVSVEGEAVINSNLRYDWNIPFGFPPERTSFHTSFSTVRFLRVFQANPKGESGERDVELIFNVANGQRESIESIVRSDKKRWNV